MVKISKEEAMEIREKLRNVNVAITNRQGNSKKKTYYVEESYAVKRLLDEIHSRQKIQHFE